MKMKYVKPTIVIESFTMTQSIASNCTPGRHEDWGHSNHWSKTTCGWVLPDGFTVAWIDQANNCNDFYGPEDEVNGVCYNNPEGGISIFGS